MLPRHCRHFIARNFVNIMLYILNLVWGIVSTLDIPSVLADANIRFQHYSTSLQNTHGNLTTLEAQSTQHTVHVNHTNRRVLPHINTSWHVYTTVP